MVVVPHINSHSCALDIGGHSRYMDSCKSCRNFHNKKDIAMDFLWKHLFYLLLSGKVVFEKRDKY